MRWLMGSNAILLILSGVYCGSVLSVERWPIAAMLATASFLAALATPIISEYRSLGGGFRQLEGQYMESRRRRDKMGPKMEVFGAAPPPAPSFRGRGTARRTLLIFMIIGFGLLAYDAADWLRHRPPPPLNPGVISNF